MGVSWNLCIKLIINHKKTDHRQWLVTGGSVQEMYTKLDLIDGFRNCVDDSSTECFKKHLTRALKIIVWIVRDCCMEYNVVLNPCWFWWFFLLCICKGTRGPLVVGPSSLLYCIVSRQLILLEGEEQDRESQFLPYRSYERDQFGTNYEHLLNKIFFFKLQVGFFSLQLRIWCLFYKAL